MSDESYGFIIGVHGANMAMPHPEEEGKYSLEQLQAAVGGGLIEEIVRQGGASPPYLGFTFFANEEGVLIGLKPNEVATRMLGRPLVGPVAVIPTRLLS
jgi:hypothetical protein